MSNPDGVVIDTYKSDLVTAVTSAGLVPVTQEVWVQQVYTYADGKTSVRVVYLKQQVLAAIGRAFPGFQESGAGSGRREPRRANGRRGRGIRTIRPHGRSAPEDPRLVEIFVLSQMLNAYQAQYNFLDITKEVDACILWVQMRLKALHADLKSNPGHDTIPGPYSNTIGRTHIVLCHEEESE